MAKYFNNMKKSGKVAGSVFAIRHGETIERAYNPIVANPKSAKQVGVRARLKLMSQLSAVMASMIAMPRQQSVSPRNRFIAANFPLSTFADDTASIPLASIKLTMGVIGMPNLSVTRDGLRLNVAYQNPVEGVDRVVYAAYVKQTDNELRFAGSVDVTNAGVNRDYAGSIPVGTTDAALVLSYGVRFNTEAARVQYGDIEAVPAETIAKLIATRSISEYDVTLTETRGMEIVAGE